MKKNILYIIITALLFFSGGFLIGKMTSETITREIKIGVENGENSGQVDYKKIITDAQNQVIIDNIMMIYLQSIPTENTEINMNRPDLFIEMSSPKQSTGLIDSKVWFTDEGAIIGNRASESWENVEYRSINQAAADYIKNLIE
ncbi:hypothetical protein [Solibacillus sp. CAU 1738]|uniref:hypothetical protein n=1 Tax=Solibacillus sp. CAU 1738 TaxID=3140363 RepID=UPI003261274A